MDNSLLHRTAPFKIHPINEVPDHQILNRMLNLARRNMNRSIELDWTPPQRTTVFKLTVYSWRSPGPANKSGGEHMHTRWQLEERATNQLKVLWAHETIDIALITNLLWFETKSTAPAPSEALQRDSDLLNDDQVEDYVGEPFFGKSADMEQVLLSGTLEEVELPNILQSIGICKMTGRLAVTNPFANADVFFIDGLPLHASIQTTLAGQRNDETGDNALLSVLLWRSGQFRFVKDQKCQERTVKRRLEGMLLEGATLIDFQNALNLAGLTENCVPLKKPVSGKPAFEAAMAKLAPLPIEEQYALYNAIDSVRTLSEITESLNMNRITYVPLLFNLHLAGLASAGHETPIISSRKIDIRPDSIEQAAQEILRPETGIMGYPLFLNQLQIELSRFRRWKQPSSVVIFEPRVDGNGLSTEDFHVIANCFEEVREPYDSLGHFETLDLAIMLPGQSAVDAERFVRQFADILGMNKEIINSTNGKIECVFGIVEMQDDPITLELILSQAAAAATQARGRKQPLWVYEGGHVLRWQESFTAGKKSMENEQFDEAVKLFSKALEEAQTFPGVDERVKQTMYQLGQSYVANRNYVNAESVWLTLLDLLETGTDVSTDELVALLDQLSQTCYMLGRYEAAEKYSTRVIETCQRSDEPRELIVAQSLYKLAICSHVQNKLPKARTLYKKALESMIRLLGSRHPDTVKCKTNYEALKLTLSLRTADTGMRNTHNSI